MTMKKKLFAQEPPMLSDISEANLLIQGLWTQLRDYEDRLTTSSKNSSKSPSADTPAARAERKKLKLLVAEIRLALNLDTRENEGLSPL
jgi:hypothetical protein